MKLITRIIISVSALLLSSQCLATVEISDAPWPRWRGANFDGISSETNLLKKWPNNGPEKKWTYRGAGTGYSGFSIVGGGLFTMGTRNDDVHVIALNAHTGKEVWTRKIGGDDTGSYKTGWGSGPRGIPTWDDGKLYALGPSGTLACLAARTGSVIWSVHLAKDFDGTMGGWGYSESPLVDGDKVIVAPGGESSPIVAFNKQTGKVIWKTEAIDGVNRSEYSSIIPAELDGKRQYVKFFQKVIVGVDADNGKVIWRSEWPRGKVAMIPTPIIDGQEIYMTGGYGSGSKLFEVNRKSTSDLWDDRRTMSNQHGGVIKYGDYLYGFSDRNGLTCQSWKTGEQVWVEETKQLKKGSVVLADGMLICLNESDGTVTLADATPDGFKQRGQFQLQPQSKDRPVKGKIWTHPVVAYGNLYLRDQEIIICYDISE